MRSLFVKILLWFVATALIAVMGSAVIIRLHEPEDYHPFKHFRRRVAFRLGEARHAFERGGPQELQTFLNRMQRIAGYSGFLTDANGTNLSTGKELPELVQQVHREDRKFVKYAGRYYYAKAARDGRYWYFQRMSEGFNPDKLGKFPSWVLPPSLMWILGAFVVFCFLLARHLTAPVRSLEKAVRKFGSGDFSARVRSPRRDEFGQLARTFDQMAERIQSLVSSQRRLLLDISHELRSPLTRLGLAVELARSEGNNSPALDRIQTEADRLNDLIGEILAFNRSDADPAAMRKMPVRIDELLAELTEILAVEAEARPCQIELKPPPAATVLGDEELLRRALENVARNAIRYTAEDTPVGIELRREAGEALIAIRDQGPGAPSSSLPRLFEPFYRVEDDRSRMSGGAGLGLAIARRSVELHGGEIHARNAHPGLLVEIRLPLIGEQETWTRERAPAQPREKTSVR